MEVKFRPFLEWKGAIEIMESTLLLSAKKMAS